LIFKKEKIKINKYNWKGKDILQQMERGGNNLFAGIIGLI